MSRPQALACFQTRGARPPGISRRVAGSPRRLPATAAPPRDARRALQAGAVSSLTGRTAPAGAARAAGVEVGAVRASPGSGVRARRWAGARVSEGRVGRVPEPGAGAGGRAPPGAPSQTSPPPTPPGSARTSQWVGVRVVTRQISVIANEKHAQSGFQFLATKSHR